MKYFKDHISNNKGAAMMIIVFFFVFISLSVLTGIVTPTVNEFKIASTSYNSKTAYFTAESGVEDALYRIRNNKQISTSESLTIGSSSTTTTVTDISSSQKQITSLGDTDSNQRKVKVVVTTGVGISFSYGVQIGAGGFVMDNNSQITGSVYSNGPISGGSGTITGSATSANSAALTADQTNGSGAPTYDMTFGTATGTQDYAQSFQVSVDAPSNKVQLYLKKVGNPSNLTVRIVTDASGSPSSVTKTSGTISASLVSTNYGWINVPFSTNPQLDAGTIYWIVLDGNTSASNYYKIGANNNGYANGVSKIGQFTSTWNATSPSSADSFFNLYTGGIVGSISSIRIGTGSTGNAYAHTVTGATILGTNYCQVGSGNNKTCNTSLADPVEVAMPISEQNIEDWKAIAEAGGIISGNYTSSGSVNMGPKKITGNLIVSGTLTLTGTIWVQGTITITNGATIKLASGYGSSEGIIISDGIVNMGNNSTFLGSGTSGSYVTMLTTSSSTSAITVGNNAGAVILYAGNGTIEVANNAGAKSLTGYFIHLNNNAVITYDSGLANSNFSSGPGGAYNISSWKETDQ